MPLRSQDIRRFILGVQLALVHHQLLASVLIILVFADIGLRRLIFVAVLAWHLPTLFLMASNLFTEARPNNASNTIFKVPGVHFDRLLAEHVVGLL